MSKIFYLAILRLALSTPYRHAAAIAVPAAEKVYSEVIPGLGLPSLASLGLTSAELYQSEERSRPISTHPRLTNTQVSPSLDSRASKRSDLFHDDCGGGIGDTASVDDVIACFNYLSTIGDLDCIIPADHNQDLMCTAGTAVIRGVDLTNHETRSRCRDVARGVQWVFTICNYNGQVEGSAAAYGNGDLIVAVGGRL